MAREALNFEMDAHDRVLQERKEEVIVNPWKINPHRVQMFSINEIWTCVQQRLVELKVMKDPEADSQGEESDSTDFEEGFSFVEEGAMRVGKLFRPKAGQEKSLKDQMKKNDWTLLNKLLERAVAHD